MWVYTPIIWVADVWLSKAFVTFIIFLDCSFSGIHFGVSLGVHFGVSFPSLFWQMTLWLFR